MGRCAHHGEGAHLVGDVGEALAVDLLGLAERAAHGLDRALVLFDPALPGRHALLLLRLALSLGHRIPCGPLGAGLAAEENGEIGVGAHWFSPLMMDRRSCGYFLRSPKPAAIASAREATSIIQ